MFYSFQSIGLAYILGEINPKVFNIFGAIVNAIFFKYLFFLLIIGSI